MLYTFSLRLDRDPNEFANALYEAGLDDAGISSGPDGHVADFDRDAASFWEAVTSAVADVQRTPVRVAEVTADVHLTGADIADLLGVSRQHVTRLVASDGFPPPVQRVGSRVVLYSRLEVLAWAHRTGRLDEEPAAPTTRELEYLAALNAALAWRRASPALDPRSRSTVERRAAA
jgi:predicted DNA-binding transcriptional regulator AlpA